MDIPATTMITSIPFRADEVVAINDDVLTEILLRLPIRSIVRFKQVSKHWYSLLTNPNFASLRNRILNPKTNPPPSGIFFERSRFPFEYEFIPFNVNPAGITHHNYKPPFKGLYFAGNTIPMQLIHSSNGGLMLSHRDMRNLFEPSYSFHVYNPTTNSHAQLPRFGFSGDQDAELHSASIAFDPSKSPHYRVLLLWNLGKRPALIPLILDSLSGGNNIVLGPFQAEIYSSETRTWRFSGQPSPHGPPYRGFLAGGGVYWNDAVHWIDIMDGVFSWFRFDTESFTQMPLPDGPRAQRDRRLFESCDRLFLISSPSQLNNLPLIVYDMERDSYRWSLRFSLELDHQAFARVSPELLRRGSISSSRLGSLRINVLYFVFGERNDSFFIIQVGGKIMKYDIESKTFLKIASRINHNIDNCFVFVESLSPV